MTGRIKIHQKHACERDQIIKVLKHIPYKNESNTYSHIIFGSLLYQLLCYPAQKTCSGHHVWEVMTEMEGNGVNDKKLQFWV